MGIETPGMSRMGYRKRADSMWCKATLTRILANEVDSDTLD